MVIGEGILPKPDAPRENFATGLHHVDIPELGPAIRGKVRDSWILPGTPSLRAMVTTDRQSAYDRMICTIPGKGQVLNLTSVFWFDHTKDIVPNHIVDVPHPNVSIVRQAVATLPVEVVLRRFMAKSATTTSVYHNYADRGRRKIYGINFDDGLLPNQELPMGTIVTPTTKAEHGHDEELTDEQARRTVDDKLGGGTWDKASDAALEIFERGRARALSAGLILVDTKYEFGIDDQGELMLIDEVHTPDSSRFWLADTYLEKFEAGQTPDTFDKEILRKWLAEKGFKGEGEVPVVDESVKRAMAEAYAVPYNLITMRDLPTPTSDPQAIRDAILA